MNNIDKIIKAIDHIESNLKYELDIQEICRTACMSKFHFIRLFNVITGTTPYSYVKKRRLSDSIIDIIEGKIKIIDIAMNYGFSSQEAYTRAFKETFSITPGEYKKKPYILDTLPKKIIDPSIYKTTGDKKMEPKIINLDTMNLLGIVRYGSGKDGEFNRVWGKWFKQNEGVNWKNNKVGYGLNFYPPDYLESDEQFNYYMPCMEVDDLSSIPMHMVGKTIPECKCAVFTFKGMVKDIGSFYKNIFYEWLPSSKFEMDLPFSIEKYDTNNNRWKGADDPESVTEIFVPVIEK